MEVAYLKQFIDVAEKNRKYVSSSATGFRNALTVFESELSDDEKDSLELIEKNIEPIYHSVFIKNQKDLSSKTLLEYRRRFLKLIHDYKLYGKDPTKMAAWNPTQRISNKEKRAGTTDSLAKNNQSTNDRGTFENNSTTMSRYEIGLRPNVKAFVLLPYDLKKSEAEKIKKFMEYIESISE